MFAQATHKEYKLVEFSWSATIVKSLSVQKENFCNNG